MNLLMELVLLIKLSNLPGPLIPTIITPDMLHMWTKTYIIIIFYFYFYY